jgi:hypothetical protein
LIRRVASCCASAGFELGAAEIGQAGARGQRQVAELRMRVIDDIGRHFDRRFGCLAGGGGIAGERHQHADFHGVGGAQRRGAERDRSHADRGG